MIIGHINFDSDFAESLGLAHWASNGMVSRDSKRQLEGLRFPVPLDNDSAHLRSCLMSWEMWKLAKPTICATSYNIWRAPRFHGSKLLPDA